jgi:hypothetical protein
MNPLHEGGEEINYGQLPLPWRKKEHTFDPEFFKCQNKIVKYNSTQLSEWRVRRNLTVLLYCKNLLFQISRIQAVVSFSHTILSDPGTWKHLGMLFIIFLITFIIMISTKSNLSVNDENSVTARIQTLISFVLAGYVSIVITRLLVGIVFAIPL